MGAITTGVWAVKSIVDEELDNVQRKIAQIVDSAGSIPRDLMEKYRIGEVAFHIFFGEQQYRENISITSQEFYERMQSRPNQIPKTAVPGIADGPGAIGIGILQG